MPAARPSSTTSAATTTFRWRRRHTTPLAIVGRRTQSLCGRAPSLSRVVASTPMNPLEGQNFLVSPDLIEDYGLSWWISFSAETALADSPTIKRAPVGDNQD